MATVLDPPSASELISMVPPDQRENPVQPQPTLSQQSYNAGATNTSRRSEHPGVGRHMRPERDPCAEHPDEEVSYFCFDCMCVVCSECVVHGIHKNHDVSTLKKAYPQIMANLDDL